MKYNIEKDKKLTAHPNLTESTNLLFSLILCSTGPRLKARFTQSDPRRTGSVLKWGPLPTRLAPSFEFAANVKQLTSSPELFLFRSFSQVRPCCKDGRKQDWGFEWFWNIILQECSSHPREDLLLLGLQIIPNMLQGQSHLESVAFIGILSEKIQ